MSINGLLDEIAFKIKILHHNQKISEAHGASGNELLEKNINKIKASFMLLAEKAKRIEEGHNFIQKQKIKSDLKGLLKIVDSKTDKDEKIAMLTIANIKKLMIKYNIEDVAVQDNANSTKMPVKQNFKGASVNKYEKQNEQVITSKSLEQKNYEEIAYQKDLQDRLSYKIEQVKDRRDNSEYYEGLEARIAAAKKAVVEKRNAEGIECDEPVQLLDTAEIKRLAREKEEAEINEKTATRVKEILEKKARLKMEAKENIEGQNQEVEKSESQVNEKTDERSLNEKRNISKMDEDSKRNSNVGKDRKKLPWYATIPVIGAIAIAAVSGVASLFKHNSEQAKDYSSNNVGYTDYNEPGTAVDKPVTEAQSSDYIEYTTAVTEISSSQSTTQTTKSTTTVATSKNSTETQTTTTDNTKESTATTTTQNKDIETEPVVFDIGDKVNVSDGLLYSETCFGKGKQNKIGNVSWRPAAEYYVDRIAFCHGNKVLGMMNKGDKDVRQALEDYASQYKIDVSEIDTSVLLSLTPGIGDTGWASISIEELEQNISKNDDSKKDAEQTNTKKTTKLDRDR